VTGWWQKPFFYGAEHWRLTGWRRKGQRKLAVCVDNADGVRDGDREVGIFRWPQRKTEHASVGDGAEWEKDSSQEMWDETQTPSLTSTQDMVNQSRSAFNETTKSSSPTSVCVCLCVCVCVCVCVSDVVLRCYCGLSLTLTQAKKLCGWCYTACIVAFFRLSTQCPHAQMHTHIHTHACTPHMHTHMDL